MMKRMSAIMLSVCMILSLSALAAELPDNIAKETPRNESITFSAGDFTDAIPSVKDGTTTLASITIVSLPGLGTLKLGDTPITEENTVIPEASIGTLTFVSASAGSTSFTWTAKLGNDETTEAAAVNITVTPLVAESNDISKKTPKNTNLAFTAADFADAIPSVNGTTVKLKEIVIVSLPGANGTLELSGNPVSSGNRIVEASIKNLVFIPKKDFVGLVSFNWSAVLDNGDTTAVKAVNITVESATVGSNPIMKTTPKNTDLAFAAKDFTDAIPNVKDNVDLTSVTIETLPDITAGSLKLDGATVAEKTVIAKDTIDKLVFIPAKDYVGNAGFNWSAKLSNEDIVAANTVKITVTPLTKLATVLIRKNTYQNTSFRFIKSDFTGSIVGYPTNDPLVSIAFPELPDPAAGVLTLDNVNIVKDQEIPADKIADLRFVPKTGYLGTATMKWTARMPLHEIDPGTVQINVIPRETTPFVYADLEGHWAATSAGMLATLGFVKGETIQGKSYFYPNNLLTRGEFVLMLNSVMGIEPDTGTASLFGDAVPSWLVGPTNAAKNRGVINGVLVGSQYYLYPMNNITRLEAIQIIYNSLDVEYPVYSAPNYSDFDSVPNWGKTAVKNMAGYGVIQGSGGRLEPHELITRAEAAEMLYKAYKEYNKVEPRRLPITW